MQSPDVLIMRVEEPLSGPLTVCEVAKGCVTRNEPRQLANVLEVLGGTPELLSNNAGKALIGIGGYDDVPEEIHEIDEIRSFILGVTKLVPWWFVMIHPHIALTWLYCITPKATVVRDGNGRMGVAQNMECILTALDAAISAAEMHIKNAGVEADDAEVMSQNMLIVANHITLGINPATLDPSLQKTAKQAYDAKHQ